MPESFENFAVRDGLSLEVALDAVARQRVLAFIAERFQACFGAQVEDDSPTLIGGFDGDGALVAAFGLRDWKSGFFCEHYLEEPLECALSRAFGDAVARREAVEVTHLCATRPGFLPMLAPLLPRTLMDGGFRYLVCTATQRLSRFFERKGVKPVTLADARIEAIPPDTRSAWGRYYASCPRVLAGNLQRANETLLASTQPGLKP
jgi:hypothetical protein